MNTQTLSGQASKAIHHTEKNIGTFAAIGFAARAAVYALTGVLALLSFSGSSDGALTDSKGSMHRLMDQPFGKPVLIAIAIGLLAYAIFRVFQSVRDYDRRGHDVKGLTMRAGYLLGAVTHTLLAYYAFNLVFHFSRGKDSSGEQTVAKTLLEQPFGQLLLGAVGIGVIAFGIGQIFIAIKEKFTKHLEIPSDKARWLIPVCKFGIIARGIVFLPIGWMFVQAALHENSGEAKGAKASWSFFDAQPMGNWLIAVIAAGLIAFAVYGLAEAAYRKLPGPQT